MLFSKYLRRKSSKDIDFLDSRGFTNRHLDLVYKSEVKRRWDVQQYRLIDISLPGKLGVEQLGLARIE